MKGKISLDFTDVTGPDGTEVPEILCSGMNGNTDKGTENASSDMAVLNISGVLKTQKLLAGETKNGCTVTLGSDASLHLKEPEDMNDPSQWPWYDSTGLGWLRMWIHYRTLPLSGQMIGGYSSSKGQVSHETFLRISYRAASRPQFWLKGAHQVPIAAAQEGVFVHQLEFCLHAAHILKPHHVLAAQQVPVFKVRAFGLFHQSGWTPGFGGDFHRVLVADGGGPGDALFKGKQPVIAVIRQAHETFLRRDFRNP